MTSSIAGEPPSASFSEAHAGTGSGGRGTLKDMTKSEWQGRNLGVPLAQLEGIEVSNQTAEGIADWQYWCGHGYCF